MKKIFIAILMCFVSANVFAEAGYKSNVWASWASITSQKKWVFPYNSREITIMNGSSTVPICVSFNENPILAGCTSTVTNQITTGDNKVFQVPVGQNLTLSDFQQQSISLMSATGAAASPVSVVVAY